MRNSNSWMDLCVNSVLIKSLQNAGDLGTIYFSLICIFKRIKTILDCVSGCFLLITR